MPDLKDELLKLAGLLEISAQDFSAVSIHAWPAIMHKIEAAFIIKRNSNTHFNWWWESLKVTQYPMRFTHGLAYTHLDKLLPKQQKVWFVASGVGKLWLFEGTVEAIQYILDNHYGFEYYLVSKKYEWFLCRNHHDVLIGLGTIIAHMQAREEGY